MREIVSKTRLEDILSTELKSHDECDICSFTPVVPLENIDREGCNWSAPDLQCDEGLTYERMRAAIRVLSGARHKYNLDG